ncbi:MAG: ATP-binding protein [Myxococcaceae bacterium]|nr:ATP-binding protein [Myxococcaceae bacterium]
MSPRERHATELRRLLRAYQVVALLGARQVGKSTLARVVAEAWPSPVNWFDLEDDADVARLAAPGLVLGPLRGLVVLDEVQRRPELFPALRVLADRPRAPARFLVLGSATPELLKQSSESLAGRVAFHHLPPLTLDETGLRDLRRLWLRGGFPRAYTARSDAESAEWRRGFAKTFIERDLRQLGTTIPAQALSRFWSMLAHVHGNVINWAELGRSLGVGDMTVRRYFDLLAGTYVMRELKPWHENLTKRQVKQPKVYFADSGLLHTHLDIETHEQLDRHPSLGASWEGFCMEQVIAALGARPEQCFFWATHAGAELDLLVTAAGRRRGIEFKRTDAPKLTPSMRIAIDDLKLDSLDVVHAGEHTFTLGPKVRAVAAGRLLTDLAGTTARRPR